MDIARVFRPARLHGKDDSHLIHQWKSYRDRRKDFLFRCPNRMTTCTDPSTAREPWFDNPHMHVKVR
jgi:hypothetical protein